jgi:cytochrome c biogenesis factor
MVKLMWMNIHTINTQCTFEYFLTPDQKLNENPAGVRLIHLTTGMVSIGIMMAQIII